MCDEPTLAIGYMLKGPDGLFIMPPNHLETCHHFYGSHYQAERGLLSYFTSKETIESLREKGYRVVSVSVVKRGELP